MPAATNKSELIAATQAEYSRLEKLLTGIDAELALRRLADGASIKDVVGHRAHWIDLYLGWVSDARAGRAVHMPAEGYNWSQLNALNEQVRETQRDFAWTGARALLAGRHQAFLAHLNAASDAELYGGPMPGGNGKWTMGRYAESAGPSHYRSAAKYIRSCLKAAKA